MNDPDAIELDALARLCVARERGATKAAPPDLSGEEQLKLQQKWLGRMGKKAARGDYALHARFVKRIDVHLSLIHI